MNRLQAVGEYLRFHNSVPQKLVEMAIIMTARQFAQQYEWDAHYPLALKAGLPWTQRTRSPSGAVPTALAPDEEMVYNFVAELLQNKSVSDPTYAQHDGQVRRARSDRYYRTGGLLLDSRHDSERRARARAAGEAARSQADS